MRAIIDNAVEAASQDLVWKAIDRYSADYIELQKLGVKFYKTPDAVLQAQLTAYDAAAAKKGRGQRALQGDRGLAEEVRRARGEVGSRQQREPPHGLQPLLRQGRGSRQGRPAKDTPKKS
jgi:hypothetical protein